MQQLTLQFEGFAGSAQPIDAGAPAREVQVKNLVREGWDDSVAVLLRLRSRALSWSRAHRETLVDAATCVAIMGTGVFVLYMAAVLQGGAV